MSPPGRGEAGPEGPTTQTGFPLEVETRILDYALAQPSHGADRVANELRLQGVTVSPSGVRGVWLRQELETRTKRLRRLEREAQQDAFVLSDRQIALLERHSVDFRCRRVEASRPRELLNQDTFYWGTLKGVGKAYVQVVIDVFCSLAFAKVYTSKMPITATRPALRPRAAVLRGSRRADRRDPDRQRPGILRQARTAIPTSCCRHGGDRAPHHQGPLARGPTASSSA